MIAVGLCVDRYYVIPALVTLVSFAESHDSATRRNISVRLLSTDIVPSEVHTFESIVRKLGFRSFLYHRAALPSDVKVVHGDYISRATYLRFAFEQTFVREPYGRVKSRV